MHINFSVLLLAFFVKQHDSHSHSVYCIEITLEIVQFD